jgi:hypothetical protein
MEPLSYHAFGEALILTAVTPERVIDAVKRIAGDSVTLGPIRAGPAGAAVVHARGAVGEPVAEELPGELLTYSVRLPVDLSLDVRVGATGHFDASGDVGLRLVVRTVRPLAILIDVDPVTPGDVKFAIRARGVQSRLLQRAGDVEGELRMHTASYVNQQVARPEAGRYMRIDLVPLIDHTWSSL